MLTPSIKEISGWRLKLLNYFHFDGFTFFDGTIWLRPGLINKHQVVVHEMVHIEQINRLGIMRFAYEYLVELVTSGYKYNKFEIEARIKALQEI